MDKEIMAEARKQYFHYFRIWFILAGLAFVLFLTAGIIQWLTPDTLRGNRSAPDERVYDLADVLTKQEENSLRQLIAQTQDHIKCDIVLVTINQQVGAGDYEWNTNMRMIADDFYDEHQFGYDVACGDGALLLDNWYEGQKGSWLSTCGKVYRRFSESDIDQLLWEVYDEVEESPYEGYKAYIEVMEEKMTHKVAFPPILLLIPVAAMLIFVFSKIKSPLGEDTTAPNTYVIEGRPVIRKQSDQLTGKFVSKKRIPRPDSHNAGSGGGGHVSRSGVRHGGAGRRR